KNLDERLVCRVRICRGNDVPVQIGKIEFVEERTQKRKLFEACADFRRLGADRRNAAREDPHVHLSLADEVIDRGGGLNHPETELAAGVFLKATREFAMHHQSRAAKREEREGDE